MDARMKMIAQQEMAAHQHEPSQRAFEAGFSPMESAMLLPPVATGVLSFLNTPDYLNVRCASRTLRNFIDGNPRFFRNMVFLRTGADSWMDALESEEVNINTEGHWRQLARIESYRMKVANLQKERRMRELEKDTIERIISSVSQCSNGLIWDYDLSSTWLVKLVAVEADLSRLPKIVVKKQHFPELMGRHLAQIVRNVPIGRNLASIILDGTGVDTAWLQLVLVKFSSTLRGLSVRDCPNVDWVIFPDWLMASLFYHEPIALKWLRVSNPPTMITAL
jgi:hypothetical protein